MVKNKLVKKNSIPFLLLAVVHVLLFVIFAKRSRQKNIWILLLSNIGMAYLFEYPVLNLFKAYAYKPYILKKRAHDQILGAIFSQALYVPITATLLTLYEKNRYWKLGSTLVYYGVERYFLHLEIYKAYWWKPYYTVFFMNIYFYISDWFHKALNAKKEWALMIAQYLSTEVIGVTLLYISAVNRKVRFGRGIHHSWGEHFILAPLYSLTRSILLVKNSTKPGLLPRLTMFLGSLVADMLLERTGLLKLRLNRLWNITFHAVMIIISRILYLKIRQKK
ncbi:hypothetical protein G3A_00950 [Bacillus sp. 17376]|uniref:Uncharacterized protein n=1 Tax=Mesobacillus boroniphilus JCM 21738 TaxID=1294265 RepID=W4RWZ1_9BACI|nr:hypothetical protein [Mesobacillus boroniphilus]ESU34467.1 hypothetical protein G3A_00950 [Bacillus sp. 17376]GAE48174.1 hypothetical protein JCM21738_5258 [Mesobacillus boroniphilus JCM 21738]